MNEWIDNFVYTGIIIWIVSSADDEGAGDHKYPLLNIRQMDRNKSLGMWRSTCKHTRHVSTPPRLCFFWVGYTDEDARWNEEVEEGEEAHVDCALCCPSSVHTLFVDMVPLTIRGELWPSNHIRIRVSTLCRIVLDVTIALLQEQNSSAWGRQAGRQVGGNGRQVGVRNI